MVGDMTEVIQLLTKIVKKQNNGNEKIKSKNKNKDINYYQLYSAEMSKLNEIITLKAINMRRKKV